MIPVKIISKVEIPSISEEVISDLIKAEILKSNPNITITSVVFERKINPSRIVGIVDAHLKDSTVGEVEEVKQSAPAIQTVDAEETAESPSEEKVTTVSDLFEDED